MLKLLHFSIIITLSSFLYSQSISASFGPIFTLSHALVPVVNGKDDFDNTDYTFSFSFEQYFKDKKYSLMVSYCNFNGCTFILFEEGGYISGGGVITATGFCAGVDIKRYDLGISYLLTKTNRKFYFKPFVGAGLQVSRKTGWEIWNEEPINGPNYFELEPVKAEPMNTTQIVPSLGFRTGFVFWKRLDVGMNFQGVYAFNPYQKMYLKYQYKGVVQPMAEYESTGTGLFVTFGIGYRFAKLKK